MLESSTDWFVKKRLRLSPCARMVWLGRTGDSSAMTGPMSPAEEPTSRF